MIGYYVHHQGRGHLHRALAVADVLQEPVTILSSLPRPVTQAHRPWVHLAPDDDVPVGTDPGSVTAGGRLHWVPVAHEGLRRRMQQLSTWLETARPRLVVVDVSVEIALLCRLHGVPVAAVVLPGRRTDPAHLLGFDVVDVLVGLWPPSATRGMLPGLPDAVRRRVKAIGALSRYPPGQTRSRPEGGSRRAVLLLGSGGHDLSPAAVDRVVSSTPAWEWTVLGGRPDRWCADPAPLLRAADVVVTHAGQNAVAEVAAARRPAVVLPQARPHDEQRTTAAVLAGGAWPASVENGFPAAGWTARLDRTAGLDGGRWSEWCDGKAVHRFAAALQPEAVDAGARTGAER